MYPHETGSLPIGLETPGPVVQVQATGGSAPRVSLMKLRTDSTLASAFTFASRGAPRDPATSPLAAKTTSLSVRAIREV